MAYCPSRCCWQLINIFFFAAFVLLKGNSSDSEEDEDRSTSSVENQAIPNTHRVPDSKSHPPHIKIDIIRKVQAKNTQRYKVEYDSQSTDTLNFSSESKQETEYVSTSCKWKGILQNVCASKYMHVLHMTR